MKHLKELKQTPSRALLTLVLALFVGLTGCNDDDGIVDVGLEEEDLVGEYDVLGFVMDQGPGEDFINFLVEGGDLQMVLGADGTVTGSLVAPEAGDGGSTIEEDFTGTWNFEDFGDDVELDLDSELFPSPFELEADDSPAVEGAIQLDGEADFQGYSIALTLRSES